eukprot:jgi/Tetstr1/438640/TSEL_027191.t1
MLCIGLNPPDEDQTTGLYEATCLFSFSLPSTYRMTTDEVQPAPADGKKVFTLEECEKHIAEEDCWLVIHGKVYDVTEMLDEHPGGGDILVSASGRDATDDFEDVGHSTSAREWLQKYYIGEYAGGDPSAEKKAAKNGQAGAPDGGLAKTFKALLPILIILLAVYFKFLA